LPVRQERIDITCICAQPVGGVKERVDVVEIFPRLIREAKEADGVGLNVELQVEGRNQQEKEERRVVDGAGF
jgi:hypothetical protein